MKQNRCTSRAMCSLQAQESYQDEPPRDRSRIWRRLLSVAVAWIAVSFVLVGGSSARAATAGGGDGRGLWLYCSNNLLVKENIEKLEVLWRRAAKCGYTHVLLSDSKFARLGTLDERYFANVRRLKAIAEELHLVIVPAVFPVGYSNEILWHDPNLVEALPVEGLSLVVSDGRLTIAAAEQPGLKGGDCSDLKAWNWHDEGIQVESGAFRFQDPKDRNLRVVQQLKLKPFHQYHLSLRCKTESFEATFEAKLLGAKRTLNFNPLGVQATQDWTTHHVVFNTLDEAEPRLYLGVWGGRTGSCWVDDVRLEAVAFLNAVRRDGAPVSLTGSDGNLLAEGAGIERIQDPKMGAEPWPGSFDVYHTPPVVKSSLPEGTLVRASYYHATTVYDDQAMICPSEPRTVELLKDQAVRMHALWGAPGYMMSHDEIRVLNWCRACRDRNLSPGAILAANARDCVRILKEVNPTGKIYVWSDMFDPNHNAHDGYYLVRGDLAGSWEGLPSEVIILPWYYEKRAESAKWFAARGHRMVFAGYYDAPVGQVADWLAVGRGTTGFLGVMYTTWKQDYSNLEAFAGEVQRNAAVH